jgi:hypothetical protein
MNDDSVSLKTTYVGEQFAHRLLWHIAEQESKRATEFEGEGWSFTSLVAMVFAFLTVEAYLNYVGERLAPEIWERERTFFRKSGFNGKLLKIRQLVDAPDEPHFQALAELKELRDRIAHGKPQKLSGEELHAHGTEAAAPIPTINQMVTPKSKMQSALKNVERCIQDIHALAKPRLKIYDPWFDGDPLRGVFHWSLHSTSVNQET